MLVDRNKSSTQEEQEEKIPGGANIAGCVKIGNRTTQG